jgi:hypothetical protein
MSEQYPTRLLTVRQFTEAHPAFTESGMRSLIFDAEELGLADAIVRIGRKVCIDETRFLELARKGGRK